MFRVYIWDRGGCGLYGEAVEERGLSQWPLGPQVCGLGGFGWWSRKGAVRSLMRGSSGWPKGELGKFVGGQVEGLNPLVKGGSRLSLGFGIFGVGG